MVVRVDTLVDRYRQTDRQRARHGCADRQTERHSDRDVYRQTGRQTDRQRGMQTDRQTDIYLEREREEPTAVAVQQPYCSPGKVRGAMKTWPDATV